MSVQEAFDNLKALKSRYSRLQPNERERHEGIRLLRAIREAERKIKEFQEYQRHYKL